MAKLNADYFSHDADASQDEKVIYLESIFGDSGYAWFFKLLETLCRADNFEIEWNELKCAVLARKFNTTQQEFNNFIVAATDKKVRAFVIENGMLFSPGLKKRLEKLLERRAREAERIAKKRENKDVAATVVVVAPTSQQSKEEESKEENNNIITTDDARENEKSHREKVGGWLQAIRDDGYARECFTRSRKIPAERFDEFFDAFELEAKARPFEYHKEGDLTSHFLNFSGRRHEAEQRAKKAGPAKAGNGSGRATINRLGENPDAYNEKQAF